MFWCQIMSVLRISHLWLMYVRICLTSCTYMLLYKIENSINVSIRCSVGVCTWWNIHFERKMKNNKYHTVEQFQNPTVKWKTNTTPWFQILCIVHSWLPLQFSLTFIYQLFDMYLIVDSVDDGICQLIVTYWNWILKYF
jgi:hypothetical protein